MKKFNKDDNSGKKYSDNSRGRDSKRFNKYDDFKDNSRGRNSGKFSGGGRSSSGRNSSNSYSETQMHPVTCANCGKRCEVPFKPSGNKPVYCSDCFKNGENFESNKPDQFKKELDQINTKLDKILKALDKH